MKHYSLDEGRDESHSLRRRGFKQKKESLVTAILLLEG